MNETTTLTIADQTATLTAEHKPNGDVHWTISIDAQPLDVWTAQLLIRGDDTVRETSWEVSNGGWATEPTYNDGFTHEIKLINPDHGRS